MYEHLDQLEKERENKKAALEAAPAQWEQLKRDLSRLPSKRYDEQQFEWSDRPQQWGDTFLLLGEVAVQLFDDGKRDASKKGRYRVRFGRRPLEPNQARDDELVEPEEWELRPDSLDGNFVWMRDQYRFFPDTLAESVAIKLTQIYDEFKLAATL